MKDISTVCSQDEVMAVDEISTLPPLCRPNSADVLKLGQLAEFSQAPCCHCSSRPAWPRHRSPSSMCSATESTVFQAGTRAGFTPSLAGFIASSKPPGLLSSPPSLIPSPSFSMLSLASSPSTAGTPSPSTASGASTSPPHFSPPESLPLSPLVTVKREVESPVPEPEPPQAVFPCLAPGLAPPSEGAARPLSPGRTVSGSLLPPCKICLDKASGFHYGLNTCEACKGFFRRSLKRGVSYACARAGCCDVTGDKRNTCGYCRYQKCLKLGMSKKAIKTGRYTHAKRTRDTLEIKRLMGEEAFSQEEDIDFDRMIEQVVKAHDDFVISSTRVPLHAIREKQLLKLEETNLRLKHFGMMTQVSTEEHQEIFKMTGLDIDNRRELMKFHVKNSERWIRGYISFAKKLPGFRDLVINDQANLVKYARIEFWFLGSYPGYNAELGVAVMPNSRCFTRREMYNVWKAKYIDVSFELASKLQKLQVTAEEMILIKAICLTAGDRCSFENPEQVGQIQWRMIRCLQHLLKKRCSSHNQFVSTFSKVFMCLTDLRDLNEAEYQTLQSTQLYHLFTENPLIMEMLPY